ncbi:MAG: hypothetical protein RLZZ361_1124 [Cyanobacteriota bacterium]|jgi:hypothetical protein
MQAYCDENCIYFSISTSTGFAGHDGSRITRGAYIGSPPFKTAKFPYSNKLKSKHSAEHKVYNAFLKNLKKLSENLDLVKLEKYLPSIKQIRTADDFSIYCGSTYYLGSGLVLVLSALPNIFSFYNTSLMFMPAYLVACLVITYYTMKLTQKLFFLAPASKTDLKLALIALKEAFRHARNHKLQH